jgi:protoporphyrinogen/coproporphyrinogen III oxidase
MDERDVIIVGAGLTGLTLAYYLKKAGKNVLVVEQKKRVGGVINTCEKDGFVYEQGPTTGVLGSDELVDLFDELKDFCKLEIANPKAKKRYILKNGSWKALPGGHDLGAITTNLFSFKDKMKVATEYFRPKGGSPNESVANLVRRRLGESILQYAVDPFVSGIYAGDPEQLITRFALPKLYALEQNYGGFIRGSIAKHRDYIKNPKPKATREVFSVEGGLSALTQALAQVIGSENIMLDANVKKLDIETDAVSVVVEQKGESHAFRASKIVSTVAANELAALFPFVAAEKMDFLQNTTYASVVQVAVGYKQWQGDAIDGFGGLVPGNENRQILGVLFPSAIFKNRCPEGGALLSVFLGGMRQPEIYGLADEEIRKIVRREIAEIMHCNVEPDLFEIHRYRYAIAQYDIKTEARLATLQALEEQYPQIIFAGSMSDGIGMADRVKQAYKIFLDLKI